MSAPAVLYGGPPAACSVEAHCCQFPSTSGECRSQAEALAAHAAHQRQAHAELWGAGQCDLLEIRVIGAPETAEQAVNRLAESFDLDRTSGPRPSHQSPGLVLYYLAGRLRPTQAPARGRAAR
jgi:hypothetical protein